MTPATQHYLYGSYWKEGLLPDSLADALHSAWPLDRLTALLAGERRALPIHFRTSTCFWGYSAPGCSTLWRAMRRSASYWSTLRPLL